ncbi:MAG: hypothetical protein HY077_04575 [Elusimicrobia bacterium]|nr:hypothetical protein [Elusimicrobiota bacterium]
MNLHPDYADFIDLLLRHEAEFVIVGAYALSFMGAPRYTGDMDIWVRPTARNAKAVLRAIEGFGFKSLSLTQGDILSGKIIQMGYPPVRIDLITELSGVSSGEIWSSRRKGALGEREVFFLGKDVFVKNKRAAGRPKDLADLAAIGEPLKKR